MSLNFAALLSGSNRRRRWCTASVCCCVVTCRAVSLHHMLPVCCRSRLITTLHLQRVLTFAVGFLLRTFADMFTWSIQVAGILNTYSQAHRLYSKHKSTTKLEAVEHCIHQQCIACSCCHDVHNQSNPPQAPRGKSSDLDCLCALGLCLNFSLRRCPTA